MNKEAPHRKSPLVWKLVTALVSILLILGVAEVFARFGLGVQPKIERFQLDPDLGWEWTPGYDTVETYHDVSYRMHISSQSLRNEEIVVPKPTDTYRIIVLGDSITEGPGVELEGTFSKLLERSLRDLHTGRSIEVINAGAGDYGTEQERIWLETRGLSYQPDAVILDVYLNDWRDFSRPPALATFFHNLFIQRSAFYTYYFNSLREQRVTQEEGKADFRFRFSDTWKARDWIGNPDTLTRLIHEADQDWGAAWDDQNLARIKDNLAQTIELTRLHKIKLLVVLFPLDAQIYARVDTALGLDRPQQELAAFAEGKGVPALDLLTVLRPHKDQDLFYDQAHLKPATHQIVADAMRQALDAHQLTPE